MSSADCLTASNPASRARCSRSLLYGTHGVHHVFARSHTLVSFSSTATFRILAAGNRTTSAPILTAEYVFLTQAGQLNSTLDSRLHDQEDRFLSKGILLFAYADDLLHGVTHRGKLIQLTDLCDADGYLTRAFPRASTERDESRYHHENEDRGSFRVHHSADLQTRAGTSV